METVKFNKEFFLVKFPIIFPLIYAFFLYQFPNFETQLIIITILLLAETHFGATWPFFLDKVNYKFIQENKINLVFIPILIIFLCLLGFFLITNIFFIPTSTELLVVVFLFWVATFFLVRIKKMFNLMPTSCDYYAGTDN